MAHKKIAKKVGQKGSQSEKQVQNRNQGKKQLAKMRAKRSKSFGCKPVKKEGLEARKPKTPPKRIIKLAEQVRRECSKLSTKEREELLESSMKRIGSGRKR